MSTILIAELEKKTEDAWFRNERSYGEHPAFPAHSLDMRFQLH